MYCMIMTNNGVLLIEYNYMTMFWCMEFRIAD